MTDLTHGEELLDRSREAIDQQDVDTAERLAGEALAVLGGAADADELRLDAWLQLAWCAMARDDHETALDWLARVREVAPAEPEALLIEGSVRLRRWEFDLAEDRLGRCEPIDDVMAAGVLYQQAMLADLRERFDHAEVLYRRAARLDPEACPMPFRMDGEQARTLLAELVEAFPDDVRAALANVHIDLVPVPSLAIEGDHGHDPFLLGIYDGVPMTEQEEVPIALPGRVRVFQRNIERLVTDRDELVEQLRITLLHEVGHHLGWDEDDVAERGLG